MTTNWTNQEHRAKRQPSTGMPGVCLLGRAQSSVNVFGGKLQQAQSIDSRRIRH